MDTPTGVSMYHMKHIMRRIVQTCFLLCLYAMAVQPALAVSFGISGNAVGSSQEFITEIRRKMALTQQNTLTLINTIFSHATTGGNTVSGNTGTGASVTTGSAVSIVHVTVTGNTNTAETGCCEPPAVPEFGVLTGIMAGLSSAFLILKRRSFPQN